MDDFLSGDFLGSNPFGIAGLNPGGAAIISQADANGTADVIAGLNNPTPTNTGVSSGGSFLQALLPFAQLGTNAFLSNQALTSSRPSTVTILPNGQSIVTGGGAASPVLSTSSITSLLSNPLILIFVVIMLVMLLRK
jgi:hypothetical protein